MSQQKLGKTNESHNHSKICAGLEGHSKQIASKLAEYVGNFPLSSLCAEISFSDALLLSNLQCERCNEEGNNNENEKDGSKFCKRKRQNVVSHNFF